MYIEADYFREHCRDVIICRNDLPVPAHFNQANHALGNMTVAVVKAGLPNQEYRKKQMRLFFKYGTVGASGFNEDFLLTCATGHTIACGIWHVRLYGVLFVSKFIFSLVINF